MYTCTEQGPNQRSKSSVRVDIEWFKEKVEVSCEFDNSEETCILFYHELDDPTLKVKEYDSGTHFPQVLIASNPEVYSIAAFGRSEMGIMDPEPASWGTYNMSSSSQVHADFFITVHVVCLFILLLS